MCVHLVLNWVIVDSLQATFEGPDDLDLTFTTEVNVIPDTFPIEACEGEDCYGELV